MVRLPEKFPEYSIMYKTILKQIKYLEKIKIDSEDEIEIQIKINNYKTELNKIKKKFPDNYFDE
jgi:RNA binding exosome subunit